MVAEEAVEPVEPVEAEEEYGDEDFDEGEYTDGYDREEIEVAIDEFLSTLLRANIIRKSKSGKEPSFADVFRRLFGQDHEITAKAQSFEEYIKGYFGWIAPEDMRIAHETFLEIQEIVNSSDNG